MKVSCTVLNGGVVETDRTCTAPRHDPTQHAMREASNGWRSKNALRPSNHKRMVPMIVYSVSDAEAPTGAYYTRSHAEAMAYIHALCQEGESPTLLRSAITERLSLNLLI